MQVLITILDVLLILSSIALIIVVLLQPGKQAGLSGAISGGAETFFGKNKAKSYEGKLALATKIGSGVIFVLSLAIVMLQKVFT
jgi:preprotein translocase subunit SecG